MRSDHPGPVNIGNPGEMSVLDLARLVIEVTGSDSAITFVPRPQDDPHVRQPDITLARDVLGWEPNVAVADGLATTVAWFREHARPLRAVEPPAVTPVIHRPRRAGDDHRASARAL